MPYNNTPIAPSKEVSGQVSLPLARVQKIINADPERLHTSKNAAFAIALAAEMFIQHLATTTHNVVKAETQKKPRRNVQYRDVSAAVAKTDNLEFLVDVVPKTMRYADYKKKKDEVKETKAVVERKGKVAAEANGADLEEEEGSALDRLMGNGIRTKAKEAPVVSAAPDEDEVMGEAAAAEGAGYEQAEQDVQTDTADLKERVENSEPEEEDSAAMQIEMEMRGPRTNGSPAVPRRPSGFTAINGGS